MELGPGGNWYMALATRYLSCRHVLCLCQVRCRHASLPRHRRVTVVFPSPLMPARGQPGPSMRRTRYQPTQSSRSAHVSLVSEGQGRSMRCSLKAVMIRNHEWQLLQQLHIWSQFPHCWRRFSISKALRYSITSGARSSCHLAVEKCRGSRIVILFLPVDYRVSTFVGVFFTAYSKQ